MPAASQSCKPKVYSDTAQCSLGANVARFENHCTGRNELSRLLKSGHHKRLLRILLVLLGHSFWEKATTMEIQLL